jgi:hypothetical protein
MPRTLRSLLARITLVTTLMVAPHHATTVLIAADAPAVASIGTPEPISEEPMPRGQRAPISAEQIRQVLSNKLIGIDFTDTSYRDALTYISDEIDIDIIGLERIDPALADEGLSGLSINLIARRPITAELALDMVMEELNRVIQDGVYYAVQNGVIQLKLGRGEFQTKIINCRSWLSRVDPVALPSEDSDDVPSMLPPGQALAAIVRTSVAPETWQEQGGQGTIKEFGGLLIIRQTTTVMEQVEQLVMEIAKQMEK